jgi:hypothetical protein
MKLSFALLLAPLPLLVHCSTSGASHGSSGDSGTDGGDASDDTTSSGSSGGASDGATGDSSGGDAPGSGGSGSGGGDAALPTACTPASGPEHLSYSVSNTGHADVITLSFDVDAVWGQATPMPSAYWGVYARGSGCPFASTAELRLGGVVSDADGGDGGASLPATPLTWTISGKNDYPQSASDAEISLSEITNATNQGSGNFWISQGGQITGTPVGTDCYELDFVSVPFAKDPGIPKMLNQASGSFIATGTARVGSGCM